MSEQGFRLHDRLAQDTVEVARWELSLVLMMRERLWPWLVLVPRRAERREIHDLSAADRGLLIEETARASRALERGFDADKINVGAIGNVVPQLHVHVIARHRGDPAWPRPAWGATPPDLLDADGIARRLAQMRAALADQA
jgi:diadenosine tetraphosphate (Ap4A) HIT family hydrolase